ncbi:MAG: hypothetical protein NTU57_03200 [Candidatus Aenigmarchaeota archaeon]|nr:hypothetical protein [Candidatus Aenigmarchaeota archaeon]
MKRDRVLAWSFILITAAAAALLTTALMPANSRASATTTIDKTFTCSDGFTSGCFKTGCMAERQLKMSNNQYTLAFTAPKAGDYMCTITAVTNHFDFPEGGSETSEVTDVSLNGIKIGSTVDSWCPPGGTTNPPMPKCDLNIECCGPRASTLDCNRYPESSVSCTEPKLLCDDDPMSLAAITSSGKEITMSLENCKPGAVAFVRQGNFKPRCQNWQFTTGSGIRCPVSDSITGGKLIATYDCSKTRNYNINLDFLVVGKSYTLGVWAPFTATGWSSINVCATGISPYYSETKTDTGDGICMGVTPPVNCGNGVIDAGEECDGSNLNGKTCASFGYDAGTLACSSSCKFDKSDCLECKRQDEICSIGEHDCCPGLVCTKSGSRNYCMAEVE